MRIIDVKIHFFRWQGLQVHHISYVQVEYPVIFFLCDEQVFYIGP